MSIKFLNEKFYIVDEKKDDCVICIEDDNVNYYCHFCNACFHSICIRRWYEKEISCPICKR